MHLIIFCCDMFSSSINNVTVLCTPKVHWNVFFLMVEFWTGYKVPKLQLNRGATSNYTGVMPGWLSDREMRSGFFLLILTQMFYYTRCLEDHIKHIKLYFS